MPSTNKSNAWYNKGISFYNLEKYDEAIQCYDKAIRINPKYTDACNSKGVALIELGKYDEAIKCHDKVIRINPEYVDAWHNKGISLNKLEKYEEAIKCFDEAIRINPGDVIVWNNKGSNLTELEKYEEAIKCFDEAIRINPEYADAWYNKGVAFYNIGKYVEDIKCQDEAIRIDSIDCYAWNHKGISLSKLGKHREAIKCFDEAIKIDPMDGYAYGCKGISLFNIKDYVNSLKELNKSKEIYFYDDREKTKDIIDYLIDLVKNSNEVINQLSVCDESFLSCLKSKNFKELKKSSISLTNYLKKIKKEFESKAVLEDVIKLLDSKIIIVSTIHKTLNFKKIDIQKLKKTREIFESWKNIILVWAVNDLINFNNTISGYNNLREIEPKYESYLIKMLNNSSSVLDGEYSSQIYEKMYIESPFKIRPAIRENEEHANVICPKSLNITKNFKNKNYLRFCLVTLEYDLDNINNPEEFGFVIKSDEKDSVKSKIFEALEIAKKEKADFAIFPELCFLKEWVDEILNNSKDVIKNTIIIGGSYYSDSYNICPVIVDGELRHICKNFPSPLEQASIRSGKHKMKSGNRIDIFDLDILKFSVLICVDYPEKSKLLLGYTDKPKLIINPCYDKNIYRFQEYGDINSRDNDLITVQVNRAAIIYKNDNKPEKKEYGGSCIIAKEDPIFLEKLTADKIKPQDNIEYKFCEFNEESIAIVDINLEAPQKPISLAYKPRLDNKTIYYYKNKEWISSD